jgi:hypothetical protein
MQKAHINPLNNPNSGIVPPQHQNININISYNLNTTKLPKSILGAKKTTSKFKKTPGQGIQGIGNEFFHNLALNAIN